MYAEIVQSDGKEIVLQHGTFFMISAFNSVKLRTALLFHVRTLIKKFDFHDWRYPIKAQ